MYFFLIFVLDEKKITSKIKKNKKKTHKFKRKVSIKYLHKHQSFF